MNGSRNNLRHRPKSSYRVLISWGDDTRWYEMMYGDDETRAFHSVRNLYNELARLFCLPLSCFWKSKRMHTQLKLSEFICSTLIRLWNKIFVFKYRNRSLKLSCFCDYQIIKTENNKKEVKTADDKWYHNVFKNEKHINIVSFLSSNNVQQRSE